MDKITSDNGLETILVNNRFAITAELTPPVSGSPDDLLTLAEPFRGKVDALNVTDGPRAHVHMSSLAASAILSANGIEPVLQMTCRDRNRIAMQADLLGASALGIHNILALRGDDPPADQNPAAKPVFDMEARGVIETDTRMMRDGVCETDRPIVTRPRLFMGAADTPIDPPDDWRPDGLFAKADAGARFVQTQLCFDLDIIGRYIGRLVDLGVTERLKILIGMGPLASARSARWMRDNLWGVLVPDSVIDRLGQASDPTEEGVAICSELIEAVGEIPGIAGAHLMAPVKPLKILDVLARVRPEGSS